MGATLETTQEDIYLASVTIGVNLSLPPQDLPAAVAKLEQLANDEGWTITYQE
ncbi:MAG: hypothetical protein LC650_00690 [Actinobacteria bacterium]|nr:hypothetical protein [Actinomycetota bacterium]